MIQVDVRTYEQLAARYDFEPAQTSISKARARPAFIG